ncbi:MAG: hypothetical protein BJ554DRAFT_4909 [Olpidium bornovanus]|uniref:Uncharacterized protein n=1 Tax=Olpidium bornovanus TaxID=278681 RepID=A0A8H7ZMA9_9FUNG|nr:MAG: hypothetical protein BJ554DRAFT_4909 [Olpidium bornovanus]
MYISLRNRRSPTWLLSVGLCCSWYTSLVGHRWNLDIVVSDLKRQKVRDRPIAFPVTGARQPCRNPTTGGTYLCFAKWQISNYILTEFQAGGRTKRWGLLPPRIALGKKYPTTLDQLESLVASVLNELRVFDDVSTTPTAPLFEFAVVLREATGVEEDRSEKEAELMLLTRGSDRDVWESLFNHLTKKCQEKFGAVRMAKKIKGMPFVT